MQWETEAIRKRPPRPSNKRTASTRAPGSGDWVTLREAESETGIPVNTLRKWIRRADLPSYLEADGDLPLRMVDLDAVIARAELLGRDIVPSSAGTAEPEPNATVAPSAGTAGTDAGPSTPQPDTMIVPVDAWNKMLNQLGNLHEAGQQLAEARERAGKAETESTFLRAQLAETRNVPRPERADQAESSPIVPPSGGTGERERSAFLPSQGGGTPDHRDDELDTTTYWRYLTTGWRERNRRK